MKGFTCSRSNLISQWLPLSSLTSWQRKSVSSCSEVSLGYVMVTSSSDVGSCSSLLLEQLTTSKANRPKRNILFIFFVFNISVFCIILNRSLK